MVNTEIFADSSISYPSEWEFIPLGKCCVDKLSYGINAPAIPYSSRFPSYLRITDINDDGTYNDSDKKSVVTDDGEKYALHSGDIVLARTGASTGKSYLYDSRDGEFVYAGFLIKASVNEEKHNAKYIVSQLRTPRYWAWVAASSMRSGQLGINGKQYSSFPIPITSKQEQDAIAETLSCMDEHIANLTELIEKKKGIRDGALEDLVSGRTRLEGVDIVWEETELGRIASYRKGRTSSQRKHYISTENMRQEFAGITPYSGSYTVGGCEFSEGDTLMANIRPYLKKIWYADFPGCCSADVLVVHCNEGIAPKYLYYLVANDRYINYVMNGGTKGIKMPRGDKKFIMHYPIMIPTDEKIQQILADMLTSMDDEIVALEEEKDKMLQIKAGAMDDLLTGRIRLTRQGG